MFNVAVSRLFWWPVSVQIPDPEEPGQFHAATFEAQFEAMTLPESRRFDAEREEQPPAVRDGLDYLAKKTKGWRDVVDADGVAVPFSAAALDELMGLPWFRLAMAKAFNDAMTGQAARLGN